jgi:predicted MFS family arabinose efflux permease
MGTKQAGVQVGAFLTGALLAPVAVLVGWRAALGWSAVIPLVAILGALAFVPRDLAPARHAEATPRPSRLPRSVRWLAAYAFLMGSGVAVVNAYLPLYLVERAAASAELAGAVAATIGLVGIGSRVGWGWASERMRSFSAPLRILGIGAAGAILLVVAVQWAGLWLAWPAAVLFGATAVTWNVVGMLAVITASGSRHAGQASGIVVFGFYVGFVGSPMLFGWLVDRLGGYTLAWLLVAATYLATMAVIAGWRRSEHAGDDPAHRADLAPDRA